MVSPVPADIDVANSVEPFHISDIAKELNLSPTHYDLYGKYKAKVMISYVVRAHFHYSCSVHILRLFGFEAFYMFFV